MSTASSIWPDGTRVRFTFDRGERPVVAVVRGFAGIDARGRATYLVGIQLPRCGELVLPLTEVVLAPVAWAQ